MKTSRKIKMIFRFSLVSAILIALFWTAWHTIMSPGKPIDPIDYSDRVGIFTFGMGFAWCIGFLIGLGEDEKKRHLVIGLTIALIVGPIACLVFDLTTSLIVAIATFLIISMGASGSFISICLLVAISYNLGHWPDGADPFTPIGILGLGGLCSFCLCFGFTPWLCSIPDRIPSIRKLSDKKTRRRAIDWLLAK